YSHLSDYLRYLFLYKFGGTYLDMDAPWVRSPPNSNLEFIGADYATLASDLDWTLDEDGMYLAPGVMRFRKGWTLFRDIMEKSFSVTYPMDCFNCVGPRAITLGVKADRRRLELSGFTILPNHVLYPKNWITSHELVKTLPEGEARAHLADIIKGSWSIHLFGKMTNHLKIQPGSIVGEAFDSFRLRIPRRPGYLSSADRELGNPTDLGTGLELRLPTTYVFRSRLELQTAEVSGLALAGSIDGRFDGLDLIFIRGAKEPRVRLAEIKITTQWGGRLAFSSSSARLAGRSVSSDGAMGGLSEVFVRIEDATVKDVNAVLSTLVFVPGERVSDEVSVRVAFGDEVAEGLFEVVTE
ncbi:galactosyltransferase, glycosyltransferase family 31 and 32 protein, partial [Pseudohyphozyma bogoriensis]